MINVIRRTALVGALALLPFAAQLNAQTAEAPPTALDKQLARIDFAISGMGVFTTQVNGTNYLAQNVTLKPSNTLGAIGTLRYVKSPLVGLEINYTYVRYTDDFTITNTSASPSTALAFPLGVQTTATEYTAGYVAHARHPYFGVTPFASIGAGTTDFKPTKGGGQGNTPQARMTYYYSVGAEAPIFNPHFGLRATFRQNYANAPDYQQTYWRIGPKHALTTEPAFGFYIRF